MNLTHPARCGNPSSVSRIVSLDLGCTKLFHLLFVLTDILISIRSATFEIRRMLCNARCKSKGPMVGCHNVSRYTSYVIRDVNGVQERGNKLGTYCCTTFGHCQHETQKRIMCCFGKTYWLDVLKLCRRQSSPSGGCRESLSLRGGGGARCYPSTRGLLPWLSYWRLWNTEMLKITLEAYRQHSTSAEVLCLLKWNAHLHEDGSSPPDWLRWSTPCDTAAVKEIFQATAVAPADTR